MKRPFIFFTIPLILGVVFSYYINISTYVVSLLLFIFILVEIFKSNKLDILFLAILFFLLGIFLTNLNRNIILFGLYGKEYSQFLVGRSNGINIDMEDVFSEVSQNININGGGNKQIVQGKCESKSLDLVLEKFYENIMGEIKN